MYSGSASGLPATPSVILTTTKSYAQFGWSVSSAGDVNGDGYDDVIVGAQSYNNGQGKLVHQENHVFSSGLHTLDLSQWNSGVYIVEVISDRGSEHIKVMKN